MISILARAVLAAVLATLILFSLDWSALERGIPARAMLHVGGFYAAVVLQSFLVLAWAGGVYAISSRWGGFIRKRAWTVAGLMALPALPWVWRTTDLLFQGGTLIQYRMGGFGPVAIGTIMYSCIMIGLVTAQGLLSRRRGRFVSMALGVVLALGLREADRMILPNAYLFLHQFMVMLSSLTLAALSFLLVRPRVSSRWSLTIAGILVAACVVLSALHCQRFLGSDARTRTLLGFELQTSSRIWSLLPYVDHKSDGSQIPDGLSTEFSNHQQLRSRARDAMNSWREEHPRCSVLMISVDAVRFDHTTLGGYERKTTPFLSKLAESSFVFTQARSPSTASFFSIVSMLTGVEPNSIADMSGTMPQTLADVLKDRLWHTAGFYPKAIFNVRDRDWPAPDFTLGFEEVVHSQGQAEEITVQLLDRLTGRVRQPFFAFTHIMDPHAPYRPHPESVWGEAPIDLYDGELSHVDAQLSRLWQGLDEAGVTDDTIIVITSDHGEAFGESGQYQHGGSPNYIQSAVPLLIRIPGLRPERSVNAPVSTVSLSSTLSDILGIPEPSGNEARSLLPLMLGLEDGALSFCVVQRPAMSQFASVSPSLSLVHGGYEGVLDLRLGVWRLFNLRSDSIHAKDMAGQMPEVVGRLAEIERTWREDRTVLALSRKKSVDQFPADYIRVRDRFRRGDGRSVAEFMNWAETGPAELRVDVFKTLIMYWSKHQITDLDRQLDLGSDEIGRLTKATIEFMQGKMDGIQDAIDGVDGVDRDMQLLIYENLSMGDTSSLPLPAIHARFKQAEDPEIRVALACLLGSTREQPVFEVLLAAIGEVRGMKLRRVVEAASFFDDAENWSRLVAAVGKQGKEGTKSLAAALRGHLTPEQMQWIEGLLRSSHVYCHAAALGVLRRLESCSFERSMLERMVLWEEDSRLRAIAMRVLGSRAKSEATDVLLESCAIYPGTIGEAIDVLGKYVERAESEFGSFYLRRAQDSSEEVVRLAVPDPSESAMAKELHVRSIGSSSRGTWRLDISVDGVDIQSAVGQSDGALTTVPLELPPGASLVDLRLSGSKDAGLPELAFLFVEVRPRSRLWQEDLIDCKESYSESRFTGHWVVDSRFPELVWCKSPTSEYEFWGSRAQLSRVTLSMHVGANCRVELALNGMEAAPLTVEAGRRIVVVQFPSDAYRHGSVNVLSMRVIDSQSDTESAKMAPGLYGIESIIWN